MEYVLPQASKGPETTNNSSTKQEPFLVGHRKMKQGLLARAALYANNASKGTPAMSQFNGILRVNRDPIVWGDASNRYNYKRSEINNNSEQHEHQEKNGLSALPMQLPERKCTDHRENADVSSEPSAPEVVHEWSVNRETPFSTTSPEKVVNMMQTTDHYGTVGANTLVFHSTQNDAEEISQHVSESEPKVLSFDTTQQLRSGFFRSIKRQYSPLLPEKGDSKESPGCSTPSDGHSIVSIEDTTNDVQDEEPVENFNSMSQMARQKLEQLRKKGPRNVDVPTGLQWIRLELHEMREQDKTLFLQLIKLHSTIKDLRSDFSGQEEFDSYDDLHSAESLWWPRRGYNIDVLPDFSSSDGAHLIRGGKSKHPLRRGFSLNYPTNTGRHYSPVLDRSTDSLLSSMGSKYVNDIGRAGAT